jgi:hypothetical protein
VQGAEENIWIREREVTGRWGTSYNEEIYNFYSLPNIIRLIKLGRMGRVCNVQKREVH